MATVQQPLPIEYSVASKGLLEHTVQHSADSASPGIQDSDSEVEASSDVNHDLLCQDCKKDICSHPVT